ncbi:MAG: PAS domain S-box protein [Anaerolineae bacterium]
MVGRMASRQVTAARQNLERVRKQAGALAQEHPLLEEAVEGLSANLKEIEALFAALHRNQVGRDAVRLESATILSGLSGAVRAAPDAHLITSPRGTIQEGNEAAARLLGVAQESLRGRRLSTFVAPHSRADLVQGLDALATKRRVTDWILTLHPQGYGPILVSCTASAAPQRTGKPTRLFWSLNDVTKHLQVEEDRSCTQHLLEAILETDPTSIAWFSEDDLVLRWANPAITRLTGLPREETIGRTYAEIFTLDQRHLGAELARQVRESGEPVDIDRLVYQAPGGTVQTFSVHIRPAPWGTDRGILLVAWETTIEEDAIRRAEQAAEQAERREMELAAVFRAAAEAVVVYDRAGRIIRANPAAVRAYGFNPLILDREQVAKRAELRYPDGRPVPFEEVASSRALGGETLTGERYLLRGANGKDRVILSSASPLYLGQELSGAVLLWTDVTEREALLEETRTQREFLERLLSGAPVGIAVVQVPEMRYVLTNPAYEAIPGLRLPVRGRTMREVLPDAYARFAIGCADQAVQERRAISLREMEAPGEGDVPTSYWDVDHVPLFGPDRRVERVLMILHDATEQLLARRQLSELAARSAAILESMTEAVTVYDAGGLLVSANAAALRHMGHESVDQANLRADALRPADLKYLDGRPVPPKEWPHARVLAGETFSGIELRISPSTPSREWIGAFSGTPVRDTDGHIVLGVVVARDITARKMIEMERERLITELSDERATLDAVIRNAPEGILVADAQGRIVLANPAADALFAHKLEWPVDLLQNHPFDISRADGTEIEPRDYSFVRAALYGETRIAEEVVMRVPGEAQLDLLVNTAPIRDSQGRITGAVAVFRDITERKQAQEAIERLARRLQGLRAMDRAILEASSADAVAEAALHYLRDLVPHVRSSVVLFMPDNQSAQILALLDDKAGFTRGADVPLSWFPQWPDLKTERTIVIDDLQALPDPTPLQRTLMELGVRTAIMVALRAEGQTFGALNLGLADPGGVSEEALAILRELADQLAIGIRQGQLHDQVQRYASELEDRVAQRTAELRASETRLQTVFHQAGIGMATVDVEGRFTEVNQALSRILGYPREKLVGASFADHIHPDDLPDAQKKWRGLLTHKYGSYRADHRYLNKEGQIVWTSLTVSLVHSEGQPQPFIVAAIQDITEQRRAQESLIQSEKLAISGRIASSLVHEINNPLQAVIGCLGLAEEGLADGSDIARYLQVARDELQRAARIVADLRDLHRPARQEEKELAEIHALLERALTLSTGRLRDSGVEVERAWQADLPRIALVQDRIQQVFNNLILNAIEAMPTGGRLLIRTELTHVPEGIRVTIVDTGQGIPKDVLPSIFTPFFTTKPYGVGLGLWVTHNIVRSHGGTLEVSSEPNKGTTFTVWLPA